MKEPKPEYLTASDPRAVDFSGTIRVWKDHAAALEAKELEEDGTALELELCDLVATPRGIGLVIATIVRSYVDLLPPERRDDAFRDVVLAFTFAWHRAHVIKPGASH